MKKRKIVACVLSLALIVSILSVYLIWFTGPSQTEVRFLQACQAGSVEHVKSMLSENPRLLNCHDAGHVTALHYAAFGRNMKVVRYLVQRGADVKAETTGGETVWQWARSPEIQEYLLQKYVEAGGQVFDGYDN